MHAEALNADAGQFDLAIDMIHDAGCKAAIAMKPDYDVELIKPYIAKLDMVLPMSVFPGFSGQSYIQGTEAKVAVSSRWLVRRASRRSSRSMAA